MRATGSRNMTQMKVKVKDLVSYWNKSAEESSELIRCPSLTDIRSQIVTVALNRDQKDTTEVKAEEESKDPKDLGGQSCGISRDI